MPLRVKVLQITPDLGLGGAERMLVHLARNLDPRRFEVRVVSLYAPRENALERLLAEAGINVHYLGKKLGFDPRMISRVAREIFAWSPQIVHTHRSVLRYALPPVAVSRRSAAVHTMHNVAEREVDWAGRLVHHAAFRLGVLPVAIGPAVAQSVRRVYHIEPHAVIYNGVPVEDYRTATVARAAWRARERLPTDATVFVCIARLAQQKNVSGIIDAFAAEAVERTGSVLVVIGDGKLRPELERRAAYLRLGDRVKFLGTRNDVPDALSAADVFLMFSRWEGFPLSVLEAMAAGKPVIASAAGDVSHIVVDGETGIIVPIDDVPALERSVVLLASHPDVRRRMGSRGRERVTCRFSAASMAASYARLYDEINETR
jgi:glycosyltransferase involved in cell wall biosynthesis